MMEYLVYLNVLNILIIPLIVYIVRVEGRISKLEGIIAVFCQQLKLGGE